MCFYAHAISSNEHTDINRYLSGILFTLHCIRQHSYKISWQQLQLYSPISSMHFVIIQESVLSIIKKTHEWLCVNINTDLCKHLLCQIHKVNQCVMCHVMCYIKCHQCKIPIIRAFLLVCKVYSLCGWVIALGIKCWIHTVVQCQMVNIKKSWRPKNDSDNKTIKPYSCTKSYN